MIDHKKNLQSNIKKFYLFQLVSGMMFFLPIVVLFWQDNGLSLTQIMILQSMFSIVVVLLEVPTGYLADIFGRKTSIIGGSFFSAFGIIAYSLSHSFYQFLIAEILWAISMSLLSGADSAFIYDTLKDLKQEHDYKKIWGNVVFYHLVALAVSNIIGGFIGNINFRWAIYAMIPFFMLMIPLSMSMTEPKRHKLIFKKGYLSELLEMISFSLFKNKRLRWLMIYIGIIYSFNQAVLWLYQPYFQLTGLDIVYFGVVFASFQLVAAASSKYAHKIEETLGQKHSLAMLVVLVSASFLMMGKFIYLFSFMFVFLQQFVRGFSGVVFTDYINRLTRSEIRATILSANNLMSRLLYALIIPLIGWTADVYSLVQALVLMGITLLISGTIVLFILHKEKLV